MRTTLNITNRLTKVSEMVNESIFQVLEYDKLAGTGDEVSLNDLSYVNNQNIKLKQLRLVLDDTAVRIKNGTLSYMRGNIDCVSKQKLQLSLGSKLFQNRIPKELNNKIIYKGSGEIFLEPTFEYLALIELENEEIIINDDIFLACEEKIEVNPYIRKIANDIDDENSTEVVLRLKGDGIVVIKLPVPENEIIKCKIYKDKLVVNGDLVVLTTNSIQHTVEKVNNYQNDMIKNVNIYSGIGEVWVLATKKIYNRVLNKINMNEIIDSDDYYED